MSGRWKKNFLSTVSTVLATGMLAACSSGGSDSKEVTITYWQYSYPSKLTAINKLIEDFQNQNPGIKVIAQDFPYDQYNQKVAAAMNAKNGPDVMNLYYGWLPQYVNQKYLQALPESFMTNDEIESYFIPMIQDSKIDGKYYAVPTAVRSLALFYNKEMFKAAGLDPEKPPQTWDELIKYAQQMTVYKDGKLEQEGFAPDVAGQGLHVFMQVLLRQWGVTPYSEDNKQVLWNSSPQGLEAFQYWMDMFEKAQIGHKDFNEGYEPAFQAGKAGMIIDGSFAIDAMKKSANFDWGVATLPTKEPDGLKSNFGSYWVHGIANGVSGKKLEASEKFLKFLISTDTQKYWLENVGELPSASSLSTDETIAKHEIYGPFVQGLEYAHATFFVDEKTERQAIIDATDKILLNKEPVDKIFDELVKQQQDIRDKYFSSQK